MNVREWLDLPHWRDHTGAALARRTGLQQPIISKVLHGKPVTLRTALMLDKGTNGEIKAEDVVPEFADLIAHIRGTPAKKATLELTSSDGVHWTAHGDVK